MDDGPDDGSKRQKQAQEDEDADADLSIHLDSLMDVLKPKKTDALADFANKDKDQAIVETVFPSLMNSEEEIDELVNMSFEMQGVLDSSPQRSSFITEEDDEDALICIIYRGHTN